MAPVLGLLNMDTFDFSHLVCGYSASLVCNCRLTLNHKKLLICLLSFQHSVGDKLCQLLCGRMSCYLVPLLREDDHRLIHLITVQLENARFSVGCHWLKADLFWLTVEGSKFCWFSGDRLNFNPSIARSCSTEANLMIDFSRTNRNDVGKL